MLCTYLDKDSTRLPYKFSPSITGLEQATGWSRRTVTRWLAWLEAAGWLYRLRPSKEAQRKQHKKTAYSLAIPDLGPDGPEARATSSPGLGPRAPQARDTSISGLGPEPLKARAPLAHNQTVPDHQTEPDLRREEIELVVQHIYDRTDVVLDADQAAAIRDLIVSRPHTNRRAYLIRTLVTDPDPRRWLKENP
jgi:hypothetical protein